MSVSLKEKTVLITGATKGIGKGIATVFAKAGAKIFLVARSKADGEAAVAELEKEGGIAKFCAADVADLESMKAAAAAATEAFGGIDVLCANAGIFPAAKLEAMTGEDFDKVMGVNMKGTLFSVQACLPYLKKSDAGRIVLTSSITGPITGYPGWAHYGASKAAQLGFMRTACIELAKYGITINAVMPGNVYTEGLQGLGEDYLKTMAASIPLKRLGSVEDIGNAALFFASKEAGYITGQTLVVDGGQTLPESLEALKSA